MNPHHTHDPEPKPNPEPDPRLLDPLASQRDHANQWDVSAIWQPQPDIKTDALDWELVLEETVD